VTYRRSVGLLAVAILAAACTGSPHARPSPPAFRTGGTLRVSWRQARNVLGPISPRFLLDPQVSYNTTGWEILRCCLTRTLLSYNGHPTAEGGAELRPDLAVSLPTLSRDGLVWTFKIRPGIRYGPPLQNVQVTSKDFIRAVERILTPAPRELQRSFGQSRLGSYTYYYESVIAGAADFASGATASISGLEAPDPLTLVVHLTRPAGDLGQRFALPATAPIPPNPSNASAMLGAADGHDDGYGPFLVSTGPYAIEGSEDLDFDQPARAQAPVSGYVPERSISLVRNPSWTRSADHLRTAYPDRIEIRLSAPQARDEADLLAGKLDVVADGVPSEDLIGQVKEGSDKAGHVFENPDDSVWFMTMNVAEPPFDDTNVRRAVNLAVDKALIQQILATHVFAFAGGPVSGSVAGHAIVDSLEGDLLLDYRAFPTPGYRGDLTAARAAMARSRYDADHDGRCDAAACRGVVFPVISDSPLPQVAGVFRTSLRSIGIDLDVHPVGFDEMNRLLGRPTAHTKAGIGPAWIKDYPSGASLFLPLYSSTSLGDQRSTNYSLVGASADQLTRWGYDVRSVPSLDPRINQCLVAVGSDATRCWAEADQQLMEQIVPVVPLLFGTTRRATSPRVLHFTWDQFTTEPALDQLALKPGSR
jgi:peptide/nickel transport system substrate-binding protein